jgi:protein required for attachment to host cells
MVREAGRVAVEGGCPAAVQARGDGIVSDIWILVADSSAARIYATHHRRAPLQLVQSLSHAASRLHPRDLGTDVPGRVHDRFGPGRHSLDEGQQIKAEERLRFAREISGQLTEAHRMKRFDRLVVMAGPAFLGTLRDCFPKTLAEAVVAEVPKDLVAQDPEAVQANIP